MIQNDPEIVLKTNELVKLGLNVPDTRPLRCRAYADHCEVLSEQDARKLAANPNRTPARERFKGEDWIYGQLNSDCNGQAAAFANRTKRVLDGLSDVPLSGEYVYSQINGGRDMGSMLDDGMRWMEEHGCAPSSMVKRGVWRDRDISPEAKQAAGRFRIHEPYRVDTEMELISGILLHGSGVIAVHVDRDFSELDNDGVAPPSRTGPGNHAVRVDDCYYDARRGCWVIDSPNSWTIRMGDGGRYKYTWRDHLVTTSRHHALYIIVGVLDDPLNPSQEVQ